MSRPVVRHGRATGGGPGEFAEFGESDSNADRIETGFVYPCVKSNGLQGNSPNHTNPPRGRQQTDFRRLLVAWHEVFGERAVRASALLYQARKHASLAGPLGDPPPSTRSLGRLLAAREGTVHGGLKLVRSGSRHDNCALWKVVSTSPSTRPVMRLARWPSRNRGGVVCVDTPRQRVVSATARS